MRGQPSHEHVGLQSAASMHGCTVFDPAPSHAALALWSKLPRRSKSALRSTENAAKEASAVQHAMRKPQKHSGNNSTAQAGPDCFATCYAQMRALWAPHKQALSASDRKVALPRQATQRWRWSGRSCHEGPSRLCAPQRTLRRRPLLSDMLRANLSRIPATRVVEAAATSHVGSERLDGGLCFEKCSPQASEGALGLWRQFNRLPRRCK